MFAVLLHYLIQSILDVTYRLEDTTSPSASDLDELWDFSLALAGVSFVYMLFSIQILWNAVYSQVNNTVMRLKSRGYMVDGILFLCFLVYVFITYAYNRDGTWSYQRRDSEERTNQQIFYENYKDNGRREDILLIIIGILFWIKVFYSCRLLPLIGPLQAILIVMFVPILSYLVFFAIEILIFAAIAQILFQDLDNYRDYYQCLKTLFPAAIGSFDFNDIEESQIGSEGGKVFLGVFLVVNNMIIIAYFVALLVVIYRNRERYSVIFYSYTTLALRPVTLYNPRNSCLISAPVPLNAFLVFIMPILMSIDDENAIILNEVVLHIIYVPILIIQTIFFILWCIVLIPFVYVKMFMHKMTISFTYSRIYRDDRNNKFLYGISWIITGPFILLFNLVRDTVAFIIH
jgi:hypothetical protein